MIRLIVVIGASMTQIITLESCTCHAGKWLRHPNFLFCAVLLASQDLRGDFKQGDQGIYLRKISIAILIWR